MILLSSKRAENIKEFALLCSMILIESHTTNPFFNIATEEYLLRNFDEDILFFYRNNPSVIIGKHQIHNLEVNIPFVIQNNIPVIRRISGGGSVYHDEQNLNYCIISSSEKSWVNFEAFTKPLTSFLIKMGLDATLRSNSDVRISGMKISGNASHIYKNRVLHHGSILYNTDLEILTHCLKNTPIRYRGKNVKSRRSVVTNIAKHLTSHVDISEFQEQFIAELSVQGRLILGKNDFEIINSLVKEKYNTIEWNVLYNANYSFSNHIVDEHLDIADISLDVEKGICKSRNKKKALTTDYLDVIENVPHETSAFIEKLTPFFSKETILCLFF